MHVNVYIYIYIERERGIHTYHTCSRGGLAEQAARWLRHMEVAYSD